MPAINTIQFRVHNASQLFESIAEAANNAYYLAIGRTQPWSDDNNPPTPTDAIANTSYAYWRDIVALKKVTPADVTFVVPRNNWTANTVYTEYDHRNASLTAQTFYVLSSSFHVYKCMWNANGVNSTIEPTGTSNNVITTGDGYRWKYMYTISTANALKFLTDAYMPVQTLGSDDGSAQWGVQQFANTSNGALDIVKVLAGGTNYDPATTTVAITGDGSSATINSSGIIISSNVVVALNVSTRGSNYSNAVVTVSSSGAGAGAQALAIIPPPGYHGRDAVSELAGRRVMFVVRYETSEANTVSTSNDFRRVLLVRDPLLANGSAATGTLYKQTVDLTVTANTGVFSVDEVVTGATSNATGIIVDWNAVGHPLGARLTQVSGTFQVSETITGQTSGATANIASISVAQLQLFSGKVLFVDQRSPISRANDQTESLRLIVEF